MKDSISFDVIIVGGSYAGLSAALALGRSLRNVLIVDSGRPGNRQTPHSHNFLTQDGIAPSLLAEKARYDVQQYNTVEWMKGEVTSADFITGGFRVTIGGGTEFKSRKLLFATGIQDILPEIQGLAACWGISALHCPYCHGYEVRNEVTGVVGNGDMGFEFVRLISNWSNQLTLFTNGVSTLTAAQTEKVKVHGIKIEETPLVEIVHIDGKMEYVVLANEEVHQLKALYVRGSFDQNTPIPASLGCELTSDGYIAVDDFQRTSVVGIYAAGDCTTRFRSVSAAVAAGTKAGALLNAELIVEDF